MTVVDGLLIDFPVDAAPTAAVFVHRTKQGLK